MILVNQNRKVNKTFNKFSGKIGAKFAIKTVLVQKATLELQVSVNRFVCLLPKPLQQKKD